MHEADETTVTLKPSSRAAIAVCATHPSVDIPAKKIRSTPIDSRIKPSGVESKAEYRGFTTNRSMGLGAIESTVVPAGPDRARATISRTSPL